MFNRTETEGKAIYARIFFEFWLVSRETVQPYDTCDSQHLQLALRCRSLKPLRFTQRTIIHMYRPRRMEMKICGAAVRLRFKEDYSCRAHYASRPITQRH